MVIKKIESTTVVKEKAIKKLLRLFNFSTRTNVLFNNAPKRVVLLVDIIS